MSAAPCNCKGKTPNSVSLRLQCAAVAAQAMTLDAEAEQKGNGLHQRKGFTALATAIYEFVRGNHTDSDLDGAPAEVLEHAAETAAEQEKRTKILNGLLAGLVGLRMGAIERLERVSRHDDDARTMARATVRDWLRDDRPAVGTMYNDITHLDSILRAYGLRRGMKEAEIAHWITHGKKEASGGD